MFQWPIVFEYIQNSGMVGNFPQWEKKRLPLHGALVLRYPSYRPGYTLPFSISVVG
jgi:hypothetical protein